MIYDKPRAELFAQDAPDSEIKPFTAWLRGLGIAFDETNGYPEMESFNGLLQALNSYIKYLEQNGFAEWSGDLEYPIGAGVRVGNVWYKAKRQNTNKPPATSQSDWSVFLNAGDLSYADPLQNIDGQIRIKDATTTQKGVVRRATSSEVANRSNVNAFVVPSEIGAAFGGIINPNGWCRLPNGLILQWGTVDETNNQGENGKTINFPLAFPSSCLNVTLTRKTASPSGDNSDGGITLYATTRTNFSIHYSTYASSSSGSLRGFTWFAIGY